jgi:hypothetical protein
MAKYKKEFPEILLKSMSKGHSFEASMADFGCCRETGYDWVKRFPAFALAKKAGEAAALKFLEQLAIAKLTGVIPKGLQQKGSKKISSTMIIFFLKTRFHKIYGEKMKLEGADGDKEVTLTLNYAKKDNTKKKKVTKK